MKVKKVFDLARFVSVVWKILAGRTLCVICKFCLFASLTGLINLMMRFMVLNIFLGVLMNTHQLTKQWFVAIRCLTWWNSVNGQQSMQWFENSPLWKRSICDRCHVHISCSRVRGGSASTSQWTSDRFACRSVRNTSLLSYAYPQVKNIWGSKSV